MNLTLDDIQQIIKDKVSTDFEKVTVESYDPDKALHELAPACLLELEEFTTETRACDGRYPARCRFSLHCILSQEIVREGLKLKSRLQGFALAVSQFVYEKHLWVKGDLVGEAQQIEAFPGGFKKETCGGYDSWVVSWEQVIYLGESKWQPPEIRGNIKVAVNPENEDQPDEYQAVTPGDD